MYVSGMPGTGKTATVLEVINELQQSVTNEGDIPAFQFVHLNGLNLTNPQQVFQVILKVFYILYVSYIAKGMPGWVHPILSVYSRY